MVWILHLTTYCQKNTLNSFSKILFWSCLKSLPYTGYPTIYCRPFFFNNEPRRLCGFKCTYLRFNYCKWLTVDVIKFNGLWKQLSVEDKERAGIDGGVHGSPRRPRPQMARAPPYLWRAAEASCVGCCSWVECSYSALSSFGFTSYFFF